jgi:hypothetical protein
LAFDLVLSGGWSIDSTEEHIGQRPVHRNTLQLSASTVVCGLEDSYHDIRQNRTAHTDERPDGGKQWIVQHESFRDESETGVRVEDRNDDGCTQICQQTVDGEKGTG